MYLNSKGWPIWSKIKMSFVAGKWYLRTTRNNQIDPLGCSDLIRARECDNRWINNFGREVSLYVSSYNFCTVGISVLSYKFFNDIIRIDLSRLTKYNKALLFSVNWINHTNFYPNTDIETPVASTRHFTSPNMISLRGWLVRLTRDPRGEEKGVEHRKPGSTQRIKYPTTPIVRSNSMIAWALVD